jgi:hypothetical protein
MPRLSGGLAAVGALAALLVSTPALAETPLEIARAAVESSDYLTAHTALATALATGTNSPEDVVEIYRSSGIVEAALGNAQGASDAFLRCLALSSKVALPAGTSPKITRPFTLAQEYYRAHDPLKVKTETVASPPSVTLVIESDPFTMVAKARVIVVADDGPEQTLEAEGKNRVTIQLPAAKRLDLRVAALDDKGNRLVELGSADVPIVIISSGAVVTDRTIERPPPPPPPPPPPAPPDHERPIYLQWWLWGGAAVALGGIGTGFGIAAISNKHDLEALNAESQQHQFREAKDVESRMRRDVLLTNIGYVAAGAFAVTAGVLFVTRPRAAAVTENGTSVAPIPVQGGGVVVMKGHF